MEDNKMNGKILKSLRLEANLTQKQLAEKIKVSQSTVRMIELGKRSGSDEVTRKIADYFNVSLDYLNGRTGTRINESNEKNQMIDEFLNTLIDEGIITDPNDVKDSTAEMILNAIKAKVALKLKQKER
jgi:transcriptional regulator with XRE-family HTH domain